MPQNISLQTVLNEASDAAQELPFFSLLPTDEVEILRFRIYVLKRCLDDPAFRDDIWAMCCQDVCFFATLFCWLHETRDDAFVKTAGRFPFVPWTDQVDILAWLQQYGGVTDMTIEKTRGLGLSWIAVIFILWKWLTHGEHLDYGIISKDDKSLDMVGRPATLMGKLDLLFAHLPGWMQLDTTGKTLLHRTFTNHRFEHLINHNAILGFTSSDDKLRSARLNLVIVDEAAFLPVDAQRWLAASQFVSPSRIFISTHDGTASFFYRMTRDLKSRLVRIATWWQANPARAAGMYKIKAGQVKILDKSYSFPPDYDFQTEETNLERSPWVDGEFAKPGADKLSLMQEIYGTAAILTRKLFQESVTQVATSSIKPAQRRCHLSIHGEFLDDLEGDWHFWQDAALPFTGIYYVGVDPAIGVADRALAGVVAVDARTGDTVVTAGLPETNAVELAKAVHTLCELLCGSRGSGFATVVPESTGIGISFLTELKRLRWGNIHREGNNLGIHNRDRGEKMLLEAGRAVLAGELVISDVRILDDFEHFEYDRKVDLIFTGEVGHGDIGMAAALAWWAARSRRRVILEAETPTVPVFENAIEGEPLFRTRNHRRLNQSRYYSRE